MIYGKALKSSGNSISEVSYTVQSKKHHPKENVALDKSLFTIERLAKHLKAGGAVSK